MTLKHHGEFICLTIAVPCRIICDKLYTRFDFKLKRKPTWPWFKEVEVYSEEPHS